MIIGSEVFTPWPISGCLETMVTLPAVVMRTKALGAKSAVAEAAEAAATASLPERM